MGSNSMRRSKTISLAEAVNDYIREMNLWWKTKRDSWRINLLAEIVGKAIRLPYDKNLY